MKAYAMPISASEPPVWHGFDHHGLTAQYSLTQHPDRLPAYARYAEQSRAVRERYRWREIAYGPHPRERFEFFPGKADRPVLVFFHGGYWRGLDKENWSFVAAPFVEAGIHVANVEYPLAPEVSMTSIVGSARHALRAIRAEAKRAGANVDHLVAGGHSAGAHLAVMLLAGDIPVKAAIPVSGIFDLEPLCHIPLNDTLHMTLDEARALSPLALVRSSLPRVIAAVGGDETDEFRRQSIDYAGALRAAGGSAESMIVPGANHFTVMAAFADPQAGLCLAVFDALDSRFR